MSLYSDFIKGQLFRLCFSIMILGLIRILFLDLIAAIKAYHKAGDKKIQWKLIIRRSWEWYFPIKRLKNNFHIYSIFSILFHFGLIIVPVFLFAHISLWKDAAGFSLPALPFGWVYWLSAWTIVFAISLMTGRLVIKEIKELSKPQDYVWLLLLLIPFITGFICANFNLSPSSYQFLMIVHMLSAELIFVLIPFSKIAHCVLAPLSQFISALAWKFPPATDEDICVSLNNKGARI